MSYIFDMQLHKVQIPADMPEWTERYPVPGDRKDEALDIGHSWRTGARKLSPTEMPIELISDKPRKVWPDAFTAMRGLHVVTERAKQVIERIDPDQHQFFPLVLRTKRGVEVQGPWFAMNVTAKQNSIVIEKSRVLVNKRAPERLCSFYSTSRTKDVVVDSSRLSPSIHLWREARFQNSLLGSDELISALKQAGVAFFPAYRATEINELEGT